MREGRSPRRNRDLVLVWAGQAVSVLALPLVAVTVLAASVLQVIRGLMPVGGLLAAALGTRIGGRPALAVTVLGGWAAVFWLVLSRCGISATCRPEPVVLPTS
jgi:hypothetical protein